MRSILQFLEISAKRNKLSHAYLFAGSEYTDKLAAARQFVEKILKCDPLDYFVIEPMVVINEENETKKVTKIGIDQIWDLQRRLSLSPLKGAYRAVIINQAERMSREAANALLKTLEEPPFRAILILITTSLDALLPTIKSRCQVIKFVEPLLGVLKNEKFLEQQKKTLKDLTRLIAADLNERFQCAEKLAKDAEAARREINNWLLIFRDAILAKIDCVRLSLSDQPVVFNYSLNKLTAIIKKIKETDRLLVNTSFNSRLALEVLMLEF